MKHHKKQHQKGFTLIEISIVLVIVGLLLGGVLKGRELIENAKIKRVGNDFNGIAAAVYSYLDRYNAIPGDDSRAATRWIAGTNGVTAAAIAGNNNGILDVSATLANDETSQIWDHLRRASLLGGSSGTNAPLHAFGGNIQIGNALLGHAGPAICMLGIMGNIAEIVDIQADDGDVGTGVFRAIATPAAGGNVASTTQPTAGTYAAGTSYDLCKQL